MGELRYTLISDGSSDATLLNIIKWSLDSLFPTVPNLGVWANYRRIPHPPKNLREKIEAAKKYYPFDILFIHRDAEAISKQIIKQRKDEVIASLSDEEKKITVCVIPIKMMETWLLIDEDALKRAAGNRHYNKSIALPAINRLEQTGEPKKVLHGLLKEVSGLKTRRLQKFNVDAAVHLLAENIEDFTPLRKLEAFKVFEANLSQAIMHLQQV